MFVRPPHRGFAGGASQVSSSQSSVALPNLVSSPLILKGKRHEKRAAVVLPNCGCRFPHPPRYTLLVCQSFCDEGNVAMGTAIPSTLDCILSTETALLLSDQLVHAVVVDMPQRVSLSHASLETWDTLPMSDPPASPATTVLQVALN